MLIHKIGIRVYLLVRVVVRITGGRTGRVTSTKLATEKVLIKGPSLVLGAKSRAPLLPILSHLPLGQWFSNSSTHLDSQSAGRVLSPEFLIQEVWEPGNVHSNKFLSLVDAAALGTTC